MKIPPLGHKMYLQKPTAVLFKFNSSTNMLDSYSGKTVWSFPQGFLILGERMERRSGVTHYYSTNQ